LAAIVHIPVQGHFSVIYIDLDLTGIYQPVLGEALTDILPDAFIGTAIILRTDSGIWTRFSPTPTGIEIPFIVETPTLDVNIVSFRRILLTILLPKISPLRASPTAEGVPAAEHLLATAFHHNLSAFPGCQMNGRITEFW
jgi:hypothetical protein